MIMQGDQYAVLIAVTQGGTAVDDSVDEIIFARREHRGGDGIGGAGSGGRAQPRDRGGGECHHAGPDAGEIQMQLRSLSRQGRTNN